MRRALGLRILSHAVSTEMIGGQAFDRNTRRSHPAIRRFTEGGGAGLDEGLCGVTAGHRSGSGTPGAMAVVLYSASLKSLRGDAFRQFLSNLQSQNLKGVRYMAAKRRPFQSAPVPHPPPS